MTELSNRKHSLVTRIAQALHSLDPETGAAVPPMQPTGASAREAN